MPPFDFSNRQLVLTGTLYGEARGCGRPGMENVAQCILNRVAYGWNTGGITGVCLAHLQFSCWNAGDPNRAKIITMATLALHDTAWQLASVIADLAIAGHNPDRLAGADSYFARSMTNAPSWAHSPARETFADGWHRFWQVRPAQNAPVVSAYSSRLSTADTLMQAELDTMKEA